MKIMEAEIYVTNLCSDSNEKATRGAIYSAGYTVKDPIPKAVKILKTS